MVCGVKSLRVLALSMASGGPRSVVAVIGGGFASAPVISRIPYGEGLKRSTIHAKAPIGNCTLNSRASNEYNLTHMMKSYNYMFDYFKKGFILLLSVGSITVGRSENVETKFGKMGDYQVVLLLGDPKWGDSAGREVYARLRKANNDPQSEIAKALLETWKATDEKTVKRLRGYCFQELRAIKSQEVVKALCLELLEGGGTQRARELVAISLGDIGSVTALPTLQAAIVADKGEPGTGRPIARACIYALGNMGEESFPALMKIWHDETLREGCKDMVLISMGRTQDKKFTPTLLEALDDKSVTIRDRAALALGDIGDSTALPALKKHLLDPNELFKETVRTAINKIEMQSEKVKKDKPLEK